MAWDSNGTIWGGQNTVHPIQPGVPWATQPTTGGSPASGTPWVPANAPGVTPNPYGTVNGMPPGWTPNPNGTINGAAPAAAPGASAAPNYSSLFSNAYGAGSNAAMAAGRAGGNTLGLDFMAPYLNTLQQGGFNTSGLNFNNASQYMDPTVMAALQHGSTGLLGAGPQVGTNAWAASPSAGVPGGNTAGAPGAPGSTPAAGGGAATSPFQQFLNSLTSGSGPMGSSGGGTPDQALASNSNLMGYLQSIAANGGNPVNATPAWQAMVDAQQRNQQERFADLQASFDVSGNRFSTDFGRAATDFQTQAAKDQNSLLAQMTMQAQTDAQNRLLNASGALGGFAQQGLSQLSGQNFQADMLQSQQGFGAAQNMFNTLSGLQGQAAFNMANAGDQAGLSLLSGSNQGASLDLSGNAQLSSLLNSIQQTGSQLGGQQYQTQTDEINRMYQEFLRTQPAYNPLLPYQQNASFQYPSLFYPSFQPSQLGSMLGGIGGLAGGVASLLPILMGMFGG